MADKRSRRRGRGALYKYSTKAGERWRWQLYVPVDPDDESAGDRRISGGGYTTMRDAENAMRERLTELASTGSVRTNDGVTVGQYLDTWLAGFRGADSTLSGYRRLARLHITPYIGNVRLDRLRAARLAELYRTLEASGRRDHGHAGEGLGVNTVLKVHTLIGEVLEAALNERLVTMNVAKLKEANPPRAREVKAAKPEIDPWSADQLNAFLGWSKRHGSDLHAAWVTAARTGIRRGELLALQWGDFDPDKRTLAIRRAVALVKDGGERLVTKLPKNDRTRVIDLDDQTVAVLKQWRATLGSASLKFATPKALIFGRVDNGQYRHPERTSRRFRSEVAQARRALGEDTLHTLSLHGLRHTHATLLLQAGVQPKVVQERLGHRTISITMDLYSHVMPTMQRDAVDAFARLLG